MTHEDIKRAGGPAFPTHDRTQHLGMTLRDYFAAKALQSVYSNAMLEATQGSGLFSDENWRIGIALDAYAMADAMIRARTQA